MKVAISDPAVSRVALALMDALNTPRARQIASLIRDGNADDIAKQRVDPTLYQDGDHETFRRDYQAVEFLRKSPLLNCSGGDKARKTAAIANFHAAEESCASVNAHLRNFQHLRASHSRRGEVAALTEFFARARKMAARILGPVPAAHLMDGRFGPGTSFELKGSTCSTALDKMHITPNVTPLCHARFKRALDRSHWGWSREGAGLPCPEEVPGNRFTTVDKDATKDRGICIEPLGNLWLQLGYGGYMKGRLSQVGLEVGVSPFASDPPHLWRRSSWVDGQTVHQELARIGSLSRYWATIDLSNASDTVALELVREVLPHDWFDLLYAARCPRTLIDERWVLLNKFSSMGNGYTFELETLVFACLIYAATGLKVGAEFKVYGDDIIVPTEHAATVLRVLKEFGFSPNERKTFTDGPFRESCGGDFFSGIDVRPSYSDSDMETPIDWIVLHNQLKARWPEAKEALALCVQQIPVKFRKYGPRSLGDLVLHGPYTPKLGTNGIAYVATVIPQQPWQPLDRWTDEMKMSAILLGSCQGKGPVPSDEPFSPRKRVKDRILVRGAPTGFRLSSASVS